MRDQCIAAGIPFFFKSWGAWVPKLYAPDLSYREWGTIDATGNFFLSTTPWNGRQGNDSETDEYVMIRTSKAVKMPALDGVVWNQMPEPSDDR